MIRNQVFYYLFKIYIIIIFVNDNIDSDFIFAGTW